MPNGSGLYNLSGGQTTPASRQETILPFGEATKRRQKMTGRQLPGEGQYGEEGAGNGFNVLDFMKGILSVPFGLLGGLFGGGEGRFGLRSGQMSPEERQNARQRTFSQADRDYYQRYQQSLPGASGKTGSSMTPTGGGSDMPTWTGP